MGVHVALQAQFPNLRIIRANGWWDDFWTRASYRQRVNIGTTGLDLPGVMSSFTDKQKVAFSESLLKQL